MRCFFVLIIMLVSLCTNGQSIDISLQNSQNLINQKQYLSAFEVLNQHDPTDSIPELVIAKSQLVLKYFAKSINHEFFALKNLSETENLDSVRINDGSFTMLSFSPEITLSNILSKQPDNLEISNQLGKYYYYAHLSYGANWHLTIEEQFENINKYLSPLINTQYVDTDTYYILGYITLSTGNSNKAIPFFKKSLSTDSLKAESNYNLAYAYLFEDQRDSSLIYAHKAMNLYQDSTLKADAARMIGVVYEELSNTYEAKNYYEISNNLSPNNYYTIAPLLGIYVKDSLYNADSLRLVFYNIDPQNPEIYNDLGDIYSFYEQDDALTQFYTSQLNIQTDSLVLGNLHFYLAQQYLDTNLKLAADEFNTANNYFKAIFNNDHPVFKVITDALKMTNPTSTDN